MATIDFKNAVIQMLSRHLLFEPDEEKTWADFKKALEFKLGGSVEVVRGDNLQNGARFIFDVIHRTATSEKRLEVTVRHDRIIAE